MSRDLYKILGLQQNATQDEIKQAYKTMARKFHPDKNKEEGAQETFQAINHANEILSDPKKREIYDQFGEDGLNGQPQFNPFGGFNPFNPFEGAQQRMPVAQMKHVISLHDLFTKTHVTIKVPQQKKCETCDATGFTDKKPHVCKKCSGSGFVMQTFRHGNMIQRSQNICDSCHGEKIDKNFKKLQCMTCHGECYVKTTEELDVLIPENIVENSETLIREKGPIHEGKKIDLLVKFLLEIENGYELIDGKILYYKQSISIADSLCGFNKIFTHPSGKKILFESNPGTIINPSIIYKMNGLGIPTGRDNFMCISFQIEYPKNQFIEIPDDIRLSFSNLRIVLGGKKSKVDNEDVSETYNIIDLYEYVPREQEPEHMHEQPSCAQQ